MKALIILICLYTLPHQVLAEVPAEHAPKEKASQPPVIRPLPAPAKPAPRPKSKSQRPFRLKTPMAHVGTHGRDKKERPLINPENKP